ncbi:MAG: hypothetical protein U0R19_39335 [Bryobacteraceae bacterium]
MLRQVALFCVWLMLWPLQANQTVKPTLKEQVVLINPGSVIEVVLKNKEKFSGRMGTVTDTGFEVQYVVKDQTTTRTVPFDQVKKVKEERKEGMHLATKITLGVLAGMGVLLLISLIAVAAGGGWD